MPPAGNAACRARHASAASCRPGNRAPGRRGTTRPRPGWRRTPRPVGAPTGRPDRVSARRSPTANAITISPVTTKFAIWIQPYSPLASRLHACRVRSKPSPGDRLRQRDDDVHRPGDDAVAQQGLGHPVGGRALFGAVCVVDLVAGVVMSGSFALVGFGGSVRSGHPHHEPHRVRIDIARKFSCAPGAPAGQRRVLAGRPRTGPTSDRRSDQAIATLDDVSQGRAGYASACDGGRRSHHDQIFGTIEVLPRHERSPNVDHQRRLRQTLFDLRGRRHMPSSMVTISGHETVPVTHPGPEVVTIPGADASSPKTLMVGWPVLLGGNTFLRADGCLQSG